jgi:hypothetical protein
MRFNFFFPTKKGSQTTGALIQGLSSLQHSISSNIAIEKNLDSNAVFPPFSEKKADYVNITNDFSEGVLVVDITHGWGNYEQLILSQVEKTNIVLINMHDGVNLIDYDERFTVFSPHQNINALRYGNILPMSFGLSEELVELAEKVLSNNLNRKSILRNYRPSFNQSVRDFLDLTLVQKLQISYSVNDVFASGTDYLHCLASHEAVLAYCGNLYKDVLQNPYFNNSRDRSTYKFKNITNEPVILRFDSWRFYEAALFGACPITLDFELYGLKLPFQPIPYVHYLPVDFSRIDYFVDDLNKRVKANPRYFVDIGENARDWYLTNYTPKEIAKYFCSKLNSRKIH